MQVGWVLGIDNFSVPENWHAYGLEKLFDVPTLRVAVYFALQVFIRKFYGHVPKTFVVVKLACALELCFISLCSVYEYLCREATSILLHKLVKVNDRAMLVALNFKIFHCFDVLVNVCGKRSNYAPDSYSR